MGQTVALLAGALKRDYHGPIVDSLNNMSVLYALLDKDEDVKVSGEGFSAYVPIKTRRNQGMGARAESAALPSARNVKTAQLIIPLMYNYGSIEFSGQSVKASEKDATAFAKVVDMEIKSMIEGIKIDTNRQLIASKYGYLCQTNGTGGQSTVTVDHPGTQWLEEGMPIQSDASVDGTTGMVSGEDISYGLAESTCYIVKKILSDTTFMLGTAADAEESGEAWHNDHYLFRWGAANNEMNGLMDLIDDYSLQSTSSWFGLQGGLQTIHGLSRSTYGILESNINHNSNSNTDITEQLIQDDLDDIEKASGKTGDSKHLLMLTTYGVRKMYVDLLAGDRRFMKPLDLVGGWKTLGYQSGNDLIPFLVDKHALPNSICYIDRRTMKIYRASNFDWMDMDGSMFQRKIDGSGRYDSYEAMMYCYMNLGCSSFKNQGARRDISES